MKNENLLQTQIDYYRARASEYDEWYLRLGRYDRGAIHRQQWFQELEIVRTTLYKLRPFGRVLELACGTGLWTRILAEGAKTVTAVDAVSEAIAINQKKNFALAIEYQIADIFQWTSEKCFDFIFFGFWLSHVPPRLFKQFWKTVQRALKRGGQVFFVDSLPTQNSTALDHADINDSGVVERKLNNGNTYYIVKQFYHPIQLEKQLSRLGWKGNVNTSGEFFLYGQFHQ